MTQPKYGQITWLQLKILQNVFKILILYEILGELAKIGAATTFHYKVIKESSLEGQSPSPPPPHVWNRVKCICAQVWKKIIGKEWFIFDCKYLKHYEDTFYQSLICKEWNTNMFSFLFRYIFYICILESSQGEG